MWRRGRAHELSQDRHAQSAGILVGPLIFTFFIRGPRLQTMQLAWSAAGSQLGDYASVNRSENALKPRCRLVRSDADCFTRFVNQTEATREVLSLTALLNFQDNENSMIWIKSNELQDSNWRKIYWKLQGLIGTRYLKEEMKAPRPIVNRDYSQHLSSSTIY